MNLFIVILSLLVSLSVSADTSNKPSILVRESVMDYLGFDESVIVIEDMTLVNVDGADLAAETIARSFFNREVSAPTFKCVTTLRKNAKGDFSVIRTKCEELR